MSMEEVRKLMKWEVLVTIIGFVAAVIIWYSQTTELNKLQSTAISKLEGRVETLEVRTNQTDVDKALLKQQLQQIMISQEDMNKKIDKLLERK